MVFQTLDSSSKNAKTETKMAIDDSIWSNQNSSIDNAIEGILEWTKENFGQGLFVNAQKDFYWKNGKIFHEDNFYSSRMSYFLDLFIFQNQFSQKTAEDSSDTLFNLYNKTNKDCLIKKVRHSLYKVKKICDQTISLVDLFDNKAINVHKRTNETFFGIKKKHVFQGFLYECDSKSYLSLGLIFHPQACNRLIFDYLDELKNNYKFNKHTVLSKFARLQVRHERHKHVDPRKIYQEDHR